jgi:outer membrane lipoprotein SlyB
VGSIRTLSPFAKRKENDAMETNIKRLHPLLTIAAISVTVFSAIGVAAITGVIPHSKGSSEGSNAPTTVATAPEPVTEPAPAPQAVPAPQPEKKHVAKKHVAMTPPPPRVAQAPQPVEAPKPVVKPGRFGTVVAVNEVEVKGDAKGVGAVGGGVAGAVLGHNIGDHNKLVTVLGAAGGALLGNQIEKQARATKQWELTVNFDDGSSQTLKSATQPIWHQGDRVRLNDGQLQPV